MMEAPHVSVVIPVYNGEQTIKRALDSVFSQTFTSMEVIVVDDASTDQTLAILTQYADKRLAIIRSPQNRGAAAARNTGIAASKGRRIAFLDADDVWMPAKIERQVELLERSSMPVAACATGYDIEKNGRRFAVELNLTPKGFRHDILFGCTISPGSTLLVERFVFDEIGGFDEGFRRLEDWDWLFRFSMRYDMEFEPDPLAEIYLNWNKPSNGIDTAALVFDGIRRMRRKHSSRIRPLGNRLQFGSSLLIEHAAALHRSGKPLGAMLYVVLALGLYPVRNAGFFRSLWRAAHERINR
jgi:glycosyltransferase involved in cell wall biosynthesis